MKAVKDYNLPLSLLKQK